MQNNASNTSIVEQHAYYKEKQEFEELSASSEFQPYQDQWSDMLLASIVIYVKVHNSSLGIATSDDETFKTLLDYGDKKGFVMKGDKLKKLMACLVKSHNDSGCAVESSNQIIDVLKELFKRRWIRPDDKDEQGMTMIASFAAGIQLFYGDLSIIEFLLKEGANPFYIYSQKQLTSGIEAMDSIASVINLASKFSNQAKAICESVIKNLVPYKVAGYNAFDFMHQDAPRLIFCSDVSDDVKKDIICNSGAPLRKKLLNCLPSQEEWNFMRLVCNCLHIKFGGKSYLNFTSYQGGYKKYYGDDPGAIEKWNCSPDVKDYAKTCPYKPETLKSAALNSIVKSIVNQSRDIHDIKSYINQIEEKLPKTFISDLKLKLFCDISQAQDQNNR